jgi:hypothetical protein
MHDHDDPGALLQAALAYARNGWHVFPIEPPIMDPGVPVKTREQSGKAPHGMLAKPDAATGRKGGKDLATLDEATIRAWWAAAPDANVGIATAPSGLVVLDVDIAKGKQGAASLALIDAQLTATTMAITGSGGMHALYARPAGAAPYTSIGRPDQPYPGLDVIGNGYIVAAPSRHYTGGTYRWHATVPVAPLPDVLELVRQSRATVHVVSSGDIGAAAIPEGGRNNAMFRLAAALRATGIDGEALHAACIMENRRRFSPPLGDDELAKLVQNVMRRVQPDRDVALGAVLSDELRGMLPGGAAPDAPPAGAIPDAATVLELIPQMRIEAELPVVHLPFDKLDAKIGGLRVHSTTLLIGGTGKGKSSLAGQISVHHARHYGPVIYYVGEMTRSLVVARIVGQVLGRSWIDVADGKVPDAEIARALGSFPLLFVKRSDEPIAAIIRACKRAEDLGWQGIPLVVVDYIQLLASLGADMRVSTMGAVRDLQHFVEDAPVIALSLSQASRPSAAKLRAGVVQAEDAADTGAETAELERGATNILAISFASKDDAVEHPATVLLGKGRFGGGAKFGFIFRGDIGLWTPTDKPPTDDDHEALCAEVLSQMMIHNAGRCQGGSVTCGREISVQLLLAKGPHKIAGNKQAVLRAIEDLVDMQKIYKMGGMLSLAGK